MEDFYNKCTMNFCPENKIFPGLPDLAQVASVLSCGDD